MESLRIILGGLLTVSLLAIQGCNSAGQGPSHSGNEQAEPAPKVDAMQTETGRSCEELYSKIGAELEPQNVHRNISFDRDYVHCEVEYNNGTAVFYFSVLQPASTDPQTRKQFARARKEYNQTISSEGYRFVSEGNGGTCFIKQTGYLGSIQLKWSGTTLRDAQCQLTQAPPELQRCFEIVKGTFVFP